MQILPGHAALISELQTGVLAFNHSGTNFQLHVSGGFVEVNDDRVSVLAEIAERPEEIDVARAKLAREHTEKELSSWSGTEEDFEKARAKLERSVDSSVTGSAPAPVKKKPFRTSQNCAAPTISGNA